MTTDRTPEIQAFADALVAGDEAGIRAFLSDDYFGHSPAPDEPSQADRWVGLLGDVRAALPDLGIEIEPVELEAAAPGDVGVRAVITGTHTGDLWGAPATGAPFRGEPVLRFRPTETGWLVQGEVPPPAAIGMLRALGVAPPADKMHLEPRHPVSPPDFLLKVAFTGMAADKPCAHLDDARVFEPSTDVCQECVATGGYWPALRLCLICGNVGCCDTSINKHARAHFEATGHALIRSIRLREGWIWCYEDGALFERRTLARLAAEAGSPLREA
jgi:hypothetical protein